MVFPEPSYTQTQTHLTKTTCVYVIGTDLRRVKNGKNILEHQSCVCYSQETKYPR